jgi:hypothetical protein
MDETQAVEKPTATDLLDDILMTAQPFVLRRYHDVTGVSGTGVVADGAWFPAAGKSVAVVRWRGERGSTVVWDNLMHVREIHGHDGATRIEFVPVGDLVACLKDLIEVADMSPLSGDQVRALIVEHLTESSAEQGSEHTGSDRG